MTKVIGINARFKSINGEDLVMSKKKNEHVPNVTKVASGKMKAEWLVCLDYECHRLMNMSITIEGLGDRSVLNIPHKHISSRRCFL